MRTNLHLDSPRELLQQLILLRQCAQYKHIVRLLACWRVVVVTCDEYVLLWYVMFFVTAMIGGERYLFC